MQWIHEQDADIVNLVGLFLTILYFTSRETVPSSNNNNIENVGSGTNYKHYHTIRILCNKNEPIFTINSVDEFHLINLFQKQSVPSRFEKRFWVSSWSAMVAKLGSFWSTWSLFCDNTCNLYRVWRLGCSHVHFSRGKNTNSSKTTLQNRLYLLLAPQSHPIRSTISCFPWFHLLYQLVLQNLKKIIKWSGACCFFFFFFRLELPLTSTQYGQKHPPGSP